MIYTIDNLTFTIDEQNPPRYLSDPLAGYDDLVAVSAILGPDYKLVASQSDDRRKIDPDWTFIPDENLSEAKRAEKCAAMRAYYEEKNAIPKTIDTTCMNRQCVDAARRAAKRQGWRVEKSRQQLHLRNRGGLQLINERNIVVDGVTYNLTPHEVIAAVYDDILKHDRFAAHFFRFCTCGAKAV